MKEYQLVPEGSGVKININVEPLDGFTLGNTEWSCVFKASRQCVEVPKDSAIKVDDNNYVCGIDTGVIGKGIIFGRIVMQVPDAEWQGGLRPEVALFDTGIKVV